MQHNQSTATKPRDWLEQTREDWAQDANRALERVGSHARITDASLADQYWDAAEGDNEREMKRLEHREPGVHIGPHNLARAAGGVELDRIEDAAEVEDRNRVDWLEGALERVGKRISELTERIRETWGRNRGPDIDWSR